MKILIDLTSLSYHLSGIERYALCVTQEMLRQDKNNHYILLFRDEVFPELIPFIDENGHAESVIIHGDQKLLFFQLKIPMALYKHKADRYMFFAFPNPILFISKNIYNTIHDMGRWDFPGKNKLTWFYFKVTESIALKRAKKVLTVSEFSKERIHANVGIPNSDIVVTYNGISKNISESNVRIEDIREKYHLPEKYIMFLSTLQPRKNLKLLVEAFAEVMDKVSYDLVLIGRKGWEVDELIAKYSVGNRIVFTGFVDDEDVAAVYKNAICFVFPTLYEGFGIPPVEALAMGTPVISSDSSCMKEILRKQAIFFKNNDKEELKKLLLQLPELAATMPKELDEFMIKNYDYGNSAKIILETIKD